METQPLGTSALQPWLCHSGSVTSEKLLNLSVLHFLINEMDGNHPTTRVVT